MAFWEMQCLYFFSSFVCGLPLSKSSFTKIQLKHYEYKVDRQQNKNSLGTVNVWKYIKKPKIIETFCKYSKKLSRCSPAFLNFLTCWMTVFSFYFWNQMQAMRHRKCSNASGHEATTPKYWNIQLQQRQQQQIRQKSARKKELHKKCGQWLNNTELDCNIPCKVQLNTKIVCILSSKEKILLWDYC